MLAGIFCKVLVFLCFYAFTLFDNFVGNAAVLKGIGVFPRKSGK